MKFVLRLHSAGKGKKKIEWILPFVRNRKVLDIGCIGENKNIDEYEEWLHKYIAKEASYCLGLDHNEKAIASLNSKGYNIIKGDAQRFKVDNNFEVVVAADIIEHLEDLNGFFHSVSDALIDNGLLLIMTPNPWFYLRFFRCLFKGHGGVNPDHVHWFCQGTLAELVRRYGFEPIKIEFGSMEPAFYKINKIIPAVLAHTSIFLIAKKINN